MLPEPPPHLLDIETLTLKQTEQILSAANRYWQALRADFGTKLSVLRGKTIINAFFEASTRTRTSFELAGKRLGADVVNIGGPSSSTTKGESLKDTALTLDAMHADAIVLRHPASGAANYIAAYTHARIINAGDGMHEHPTQALLDTFTIRQHKGTDLSGLRIAICGDITHSRVARSNTLLLRRQGCEVRLAGPRTLLPKGVEQWGAQVFDRLEPAIAGADVVMMLRIQRERLQSALLPSLREYARVFGLNQVRLARASPEVLVMHPGPLNRGVEISNEVADGKHAVILEQVEAGVAVRMAVLEQCMSSLPSE